MTCRGPGDDPAMTERGGTVGGYPAERKLRHVAVHGDELPLFFYSDLFLKHPEVRDMFPVSMTAQRSHFADALVKIVSQVTALMI